MTLVLPPDHRPDRAPDGPQRWAPPVLPRDLRPVMGPVWPWAHARPVNARLLEACRRNDLAGVCRALAEGADPNVQSQAGNTPLRIAIKTPDDRPVWDPRLVRVLLEAGADPDHRDRQGNTVALMAWMYSHNAPGAMAVTTWLVNHPLTDVTVASDSGSTMISTAFYAPDLVTTLVRRGENPNRTRDGHNALWPATTALGHALRLGTLNSARLVRAFVAAGADVNAAPEEGEPALAFVLSPASEVSVDAVKALLDAGADPWWAAAGGATLDDRLALHRARRVGDVRPQALVDLLAEARERHRLRQSLYALPLPTSPRERRRL